MSSSSGPRSTSSATPHSDLLTENYRSERVKTEVLKTESRELDAKFEENMHGELRSLKEAVAKSNAESEEAATTARYVTLPPTHASPFFMLIGTFRELSLELTRLRRLLRAAGRSPVEESPGDS